MKFRKGRPQLTELQQKTRNALCSLVKYGFKAKELMSLCGYGHIQSVYRKIMKCKHLGIK